MDQQCYVFAQLSRRLWNNNKKGRSTCVEIETSHGLAQTAAPSVWRDYC